MTRDEVMEEFLKALSDGNEDAAEYWQAQLDEMDGLNDA